MTSKMYIKKKRKKNKLTGLPVNAALEERRHQHLEDWPGVAKAQKYFGTFAKGTLQSQVAHSDDKWFRWWSPLLEFLARCRHFQLRLTVHSVKLGTLLTFHWLNHIFDMSRSIWVLSLFSVTWRTLLRLNRRTTGKRRWGGTDLKKEKRTKKLIPLWYLILWKFKVINSLALFQIT